jgi:hypothetical protein
VLVAAGGQAVAGSAGSISVAVDQALIIVHGHDYWSHVVAVAVLASRMRTSGWPHVLMGHAAAGHGTPCHAGAGASRQCVAAGMHSVRHLGMD